MKLILILTFFAFISCKSSLSIAEKNKRIEETKRIANDEINSRIDDLHDEMNDQDFNEYDREF